MPTRDYDAFEKWVDNVLFGTMPLMVAKTTTVSEKKPVSPFEIQSVLNNRKKNAFTVVWADGTHTTVHCQSGDEWDDEKALAMCFTKKALGNKGNFNNKFNDALDNKMKVIPADPAPEKACACDGKRDHGIHSCTECKCKEEKRHETIPLEAVTAEHADLNEPTAAKKCAEDMKEAVEKLKKSANIATSSFTDMINELVGESKTKPEPANTYKVYIKIGGVSHFDSNKYSIESLRARVHEIAEELYGKKPYYYRTWIGANNRMQIDFGHYTQFIEVEGITPDELAKH